MANLTNQYIEDVLLPKFGFPIDSNQVEEDFKNQSLYVLQDLLYKSIKNKPSTGHEAIDNLIAKSKRLKEKVESKDDFRFGQFGNIKTNLIESLFKNRDLLNVEISGRTGKNKQLYYGLGGNKDNFGFGISKRF
tara:strand:- start:70 stop:471 length:402 start_codon:yes stop_codon:yes gene_type:complete